MGDTSPCTRVWAMAVESGCILQSKAPGSRAVRYVRVRHTSDKKKVEARELLGVKRVHRKSTDKQFTGKVFFRRPNSHDDRRDL